LTTTSLSLTLHFGVFTRGQVIQRC